MRGLQRLSYASECKKTPKNRTVRINRELTAMHREVLDNLNSIRRTAENEPFDSGGGTFGVMVTEGTGESCAEDRFRPT